MDKEIVVHIHDGILLFSYKKSVLMSWMNLGPIIQSEVSQKEKGTTEDEMPEWHH